MRHEKVIKDSRGTVSITVDLHSFAAYTTDRQGNEYRYDVIVHHIAPKKRTPIYNDTIATPAEILAAKLELWNKIKPC